MKIKENKGKRHTKGLILFIMVMVIFLAGFFLIHRMSGKITVTVNGEKELLTDLECKSLSLEKQERMLYIGGSPVVFMNSGTSHDMYEYSFGISNEEMNVIPRIQVFKTNSWAKYSLDINVNIYNAEEMWNGNITVKVNGRTYTEDFVDIEHNEMAIRVE